MDRNIGVWDISRGVEQCAPHAQMLPGLGGHVYAVATSSFSPVAVGVGDETIRLWDLAALEEEEDGEGEEGGEEGGKEEDPEKGKTQNSSKRRKATKKEQSTGKSSTTMEVIWKPIQAKVTSLSWHPSDSTTLAFGTEDGYIGLIDTLRSSNSMNELSSSSGSGSGSGGGSGGGGRSSSSSHVCEAVQLSAVRQLVWTSSTSVVSLCDRGTLIEVEFESSKDEGSGTMKEGGASSSGDGSGGSGVIQLSIQNISELDNVLSVPNHPYHATTFQCGRRRKRSGRTTGEGTPLAKTTNDHQVVVVVGTKFGELLFFSVDVVANINTTAAATTHTTTNSDNSDNRTLAWNTASLLRIVHCHKSRVTGLHWQHERIASAATDGTVYVQQLLLEEQQDNNELNKEKKEAHNSEDITSMEQDEGGETTAMTTARRNKTVCFPLQTHCMRSFCKSIKAIAWNNPDRLERMTTKKEGRSEEEKESRHLLAGASSDGRVGVWSWSSQGNNGVAALVVDAHHDCVLCCVWSSLFSNVLITGSADQTAKVWTIRREDLDARQHLPALLEKSGDMHDKPQRATGEEVQEDVKKERKQRKRGNGNGKGNGKQKNKFSLTALEMEIIKCGQLARVLYARMGSGSMTAELVALSPSCGMWREAALSYERSLQRQGKHSESALYLTALGDVPLE